jgi:ectoine hydroxylase
MQEGSLALTDDERRQYELDGFIVRQSVLSPDEVDELTRASEELCERLVGYSQDERKEDVSAFYVFEQDPLRNVIIKWEPGDKKVIQGVEPVAHLSPLINDYGHHPGLTTPSRDLLGVDDVGLFTEKLNVKRAGVGGAYALHRDFPYWHGTAPDAHALLTVLVALDDASATNGALEVLPGSHLIENPPFKESELDFERAELDPDRMDTSAMVPVELEAGSAVFFGPMLIHRSGPNTSGQHRRAILYTYQRAGQRDQRDIFREWLNPS